MANVRALFALILLAGCTTAADGPSTVSSISVGDAADGPVSPDVVAASPGAGTDYRIAALDMLEVSVFKVPDLNKTVQVSSSGQIALPLIGAVKAGGKTVSELEAEIAAQLGAEYIQSPQVSVFVKEALSRRITVEGAVNKPGIYATTGQTTLLQAIALAGGLSRLADSRGVVVFRKIDGKRSAAGFDYAGIRAGTIDDPIVYGGDVVVVDQSGLKATLREIRESIGLLGLFIPLI